MLAFSFMSRFFFFLTGAPGKTRTLKRANFRFSHNAPLFDFFFFFTHRYELFFSSQMCCINCCPSSCRHPPNHIDWHPAAVATQGQCSSWMINNALSYYTLNLCFFQGAAACPHTRLSVFDSGFWGRNIDPLQIWTAQTQFDLLHLTLPGTTTQNTAALTLNNANQHCKILIALF